MASLPSVAFGLNASLKLDPELRKHPSSSSLPTENKTSSITYQRSSISTQLNSNVEPVKPLELQEALSLLKEGKRVQSSYYVPLLNQCIDNNSVSETQIVHAHMIKTGTQEDSYVVTFLVNVYAKCRDMVSAQKVFDNLSRRNVVAWTALMTGYIRSSEPDVAIEIFLQMLESGSFPTNYTLGIVFNACSTLDSIELVRQLHAYSVKYRIDYDPSIGNALCSLYSRFGSLRSAVNAFQRIVEKDVISWSAVITACGENGTAEMGLKFFVEMLHEDVEPNGYTLTSVLSLCCMMLSLSAGKQVHSLSIKLGYDTITQVSNSLMYLYLKCGCIDEAQKFFNGMDSSNLVTWNAMIAGLEQAMDLAKDNFSVHHSGTEALNFYVMLNRSGMKPDMFTLSSVLTVCGSLVALEQGEQIHAQTIKSGFLSDVVVGTALVNLYNKCGSIERAGKAFLEISTRTLISWTAMITSYALHGYSPQALQLFEDMRLVGVRPNHITFVGVLAACSHAGMVDEALGYFNAMQKEYRIKPVMDHYGCLVDMFVRLGRLDEAFDVVKKMNFEPNEYIWSLLIAGCRAHGNYELGLCAAERLLKLNPIDIETYLRVLNMYTSAERWEDVSRVRKLMEEEKVGNLNDWSWISIKDKVHAFQINDTLQSHKPEVHEWLQELLDKAKSFVYELDKSMELIDGEEEGKGVSSAVCHSEKLAVAFGLLNTHKGASLRIVKSTSMCKDCHDFIKILSIVSKRTIVIRDRKRLHRFVNGQCSCADFGVILEYITLD